MAKSLVDLLTQRPVDRAMVDGHKQRLLGGTRLFQLRELREALGVTQVQLALLLDVTQNRISRLERGDIERTQVNTLRRYAKAVGGELRIEVEIGSQRIRVA